MASDESGVNVSDERVRNLPNVELPKEEYWEGSFGDYTDKVLANPRIVRTAFQRIHDAIMSHGKREYTYLKRSVTHYNVFDDPFTHNNEYAVYDLDIPLMKLVSVIQAGSYGYGQERRIILLHGPVGSSKSTIAGLFSHMLEGFSRTEEGQTYKPVWQVDKNNAEGIDILGTLGEFETNRIECPLHEEPLRILPARLIRPQVLKYLNEKIASRAGNKKPEHLIQVEGDACPRCSDIFEKFMRLEGQDWKKVLEKYLRIQRMVFSRTKRIGIASVRPKAEKDQDASELSGSTNFAALAKFGDEVDPRTFNFRGHAEQANRGYLGIEEMLKFSLGFMYDYLGMSQEHRIQPRGFMEIDIDLMILGSTNNEEYKGLKEKKTMEALRDRIIKIDIPYATRLSEEKKIYQKSFNTVSGRGKHLMPQTIEIAAFWRLLTCYEKPEKFKLSLRDKVHLYDGKNVDGYNEDSIRELRDEYPNEGMSGISPRFIQDRISNAFVHDETEKCVDVFVVLNEIKEAIPHHQHINGEEMQKHYLSLVSIAQEELDEILKTDIQRAVTDPAAVRKLGKEYIQNVLAHRNKRKVRDPITKQDIPPNVNLMEAIENAAGITAHEEFREKITNQIAQRMLDRERDGNVPELDILEDERLERAIELYLFEQKKNQVNWAAALSRDSYDADEQVKLDTLRQRLISDRGYCTVCAGNAIKYVAGLFHRGSTAKESTS